MKKIVSLSLVCIMLLSLLGTVSFAEEKYSVIKSVAESSGWFNKSGKAEFIYNDQKNGAYTDKDKYPSISFNWDYGTGKHDQQMFEFDLPRTSKYLISFRSKQGAGPRTTLYVYSKEEQDYKRVTEVTLPTTGGKFAFTDMAIIDADAGVLKIKVEMSYADCDFNAIKVEEVTAPELVSVKAGGNEVSENDVIKRGTDTFQFEFSSNLNPLSSGQITISGDGKTIASKNEISENKVFIDLLETLDYEKKYTVSITGIKDAYGAFGVSVQFPFETGNKEADSVLSFANGIVCETIYNDITVSGQVIGTKQQGIKGREVEIFLKDKEGNISDNPVAKTTSGDGGLFTASFKIPEGSEAGVYVALVMAEYQPGPLEKEFNFVSKDLEDKLLYELSLIETDELIGAYLNDHAQEFMINPEADMVGITDADKFYRHFVKAEHADGDAFREFYKKHLYLEMINQAESKDAVADILSNEEACTLLDINSEKMAFLSENMDNLANDCFGLDEIENAYKLSEEIAKLINKWLGTEYGIEASDSAAKNVEAKQGQEIILSLDLEKAITNADELVYFFEFSDATGVESEQVELSVNGEYTLEKKDNTITVSVKPKRLLKDTKEIGKLSLVAANKGDYTAKVSGGISYVIEKDGKTTDMYADINSKTIDISIEEKTVQKNPNRVTTTPSGGGGGSAFIPPVTTPTEAPNEAPTEVPTDEPAKEYEFADVSDYAWAEEGIYALLEKGVISKSEDNCFNPGSFIKREELVKMLVEAFGFKNESAKCDFKDVPEDSWFYPYVASAIENGLVKGIGDNLFGSSRFVTREEMATLIYRAFENVEANSENNPFADDGEISEYAKTAVYHMVSKGIINGIGENRFAPKECATRAMAAKVIYGMIKEAK